MVELSGGPRGLGAHGDDGVQGKETETVGVMGEKRKSVLMEEKAGVTEATPAPDLEGLIEYRSDCAI